jgi:L-ascorbate oxidase
MYLKDYEDHPCIRDCSVFRVPMECTYDFIVEYQYVISRSCFNCTQNPSDCFRPNCISANGVPRAVQVVNRQLPGPTIQVCQGDIIVVNVTNNLDTFEATGIHWHGIRQVGTQNMDGVGMITQCPIPPLKSFKYR